MKGPWGQGHEAMGGAGGPGAGAGSIGDSAARLGGGPGGGGGATERMRASSSPGEARFSSSALTRMATYSCLSSVSSGANS
jgi:hypothetical protein